MSALAILISPRKSRKRADYGFGEYGFLPLAEFRGQNSLNSSQPIICVSKRTHRVSAELIEFSLPKQYSRNSIPKIPQIAQMGSPKCVLGESLDRRFRWKCYRNFPGFPSPRQCQRGKLFSLRLEAFLLTVELLCLQSVEVLLRHTFPPVSKEAQL